MVLSTKGERPCCYGCSCSLRSSPLSPLVRSQLPNTHYHNAFLESWNEHCTQADFQAAQAAQAAGYASGVRAGAAAGGSARASTAAAQTGGAAAAATAAGGMCVCVCVRFTGGGGGGSSERASESDRRFGKKHNVAHLRGSWHLGLRCRVLLIDVGVTSFTQTSTWYQ